MKIRLLKRSWRFLNSLLMRTFLRWVGVLILVLIPIGAVFLNIQNKQIAENLSVLLLKKAEVLSAYLEQNIQENAAVTLNNPNLLLTRNASRLDDLLVPLDVKKNIEQIYAGQNLIYFFGDGESLRLLYLQPKMNGGFHYQLFDAGFLINFFLESPSLDGNPTFLFNQDLKPVISNLIENNFQVPHLWTEVVRENESAISFKTLLKRKVGSSNYYLMSSGTGNLKLILLQAIPEEEAMAPVYTIVKNEILVFLMMMPVLFVIAFLYARRESRDLRYISDVLKDIASQKFEQEVLVRYSDERKLIYFHLRKLHSKLKRYFEMQVDQIIQTENKLRTIAENIPDLLYLIDRNGNLLYTNQKKEVRYELQDDGLPLTSFELLQQIFAKVPSHKKSVSHELEAFNENGEYRYLQILREAWMTKEREVAGFVYLIRDITEKKTMFEKEVDFATKIQREYLPDRKVPFTNIEYVFQYLPMAGVGGDYYDFFATETGKIVFVVADIAGHGIQAALSMTVIRVLFRQICRDTDDPNEIATRFNESLVNEVPGTNLIPITFLVVDQKEQEIHYHNLGQADSFLLRDTEVTPLTRTGVIPGLISKKASKARTYPIREDEVWVLCTDGVVECRKKEGDILGEDRLIEILRELNYTDLSNASEQLLEHLRHFVQGEPFNDDITYLMIRFQAS